MFQNYYMGKPVQEALNAAVKAQKDINSLLKGVDQGANLLSINQKFREIINRIQFMGAVVEPDTDEPQSNQFPPITEFMGEKIGKVKVDYSEVSPEQAEKKAFLEKVETLENTISALSATEVLRHYSAPVDQTVIRGVAKRAGVKDFDSREVTEEFIDELKETIAGKAEASQLQQNIDSKSSSQQKADEIEMLLKERGEVVAKLEVLGKDLKDVTESLIVLKGKKLKLAEAMQGKLKAEITQLEDRQLEIEEVLETNKVEY